MRPFNVVSSCAAAFLGFLGGVTTFAEDVDLKVRIEPQLAALRKARTSADWAKAKREILKAGAGAKALLADELNTPYGNVRLTVDQLSGRIARGKSIWFVSTLHNEGNSGVWIDPKKIRLHGQTARAFSLGAVKTQLAGGAGGFDLARMIQGQQEDEDDENGEAPCIYLEPGGSYSRKIEVDGENLEFVGEVKFIVHYSGAAPASPFGIDLRQMQRRMRQQQGMEDEDEDEDDGKVEAVTLCAVVSSESPWVVVAPPMEESAKQGMALRLAEKPTATKDGIPVRLVMRAPARSMSVPTPVTRGFWYALLDAQGKPAQWGRLDAEESRGSSSKERTLKPNEELETSGTIFPKLSAGKYKLVCGFSAHARKKQGADPMRQIMRQMQGGEEDEDEEDGPEKWVGDAVSSAVEVEIR